MNLGVAYVLSQTRMGDTWVTHNTNVLQRNGIVTLHDLMSANDNQLLACGVTSYHRKLIRDARMGCHDIPLTTND